METQTIITIRRAFKNNPQIENYITYPPGAVLTAGINGLAEYTGISVLFIEQNLRVIQNLID